MRSAIAHHSEPDDQPVPSSNPCPQPAPPQVMVYMLSVTSYGIEYPVQLVWVSCPGYVPSQLLVNINSIAAETRTTIQTSKSLLQNSAGSV